MTSHIRLATAADGAALAAIYAPAVEGQATSFAGALATGLDSIRLEAST
jgi:hypothetical protein